MLLQLLLCIIDEAVGLILEVNDCLLLFILFLGRLSFIHHAFNVSIRETTRRFNCDVLLLSSRFILGSHIHDTVGIDIERYLDLWVTTRSHWDAGELEVA